MRNVLYSCLILTLFLGASSVSADESAVPAQKFESTTKKPSSQKSPRSLLSVDPYDVGGTSLESETPENKRWVDPYDVITPYDKSFAVDPNDAEYIQPESPASSSPNVADPTPQFIKEWQKSWDDWRERTSKAQPPVTMSDIKTEMLAGYVGGFGGSVIGLFSGFLVGSLYGELADCSRCWIDFATGGSVIGASLLTSTGVYMFGNNEQQLGSIYATTAGSLVSVALAAGYYQQERRARRSGFILLTMPMFATLGYNMSRYYRKPGEKPLFENFFIDDTWVSADPEAGVIAFNLSARF